MNLQSLVMVTNIFVCNCLIILPTQYDKKGRDIHISSISGKPRPSPIDLVRSSMITIKSWKSLHFSPEHSTVQTFKRSVQDDGLEVNFDFDAVKPTITVGIMQFRYEFEKLFFHWDNNSANEHGSYHTVEGKYFPMELQAYYKMIPTTSIFGGLLPGYFQNALRTVIISQFLKLDSMDNPAILTILNDSKISIDKLVPPLQEYAIYRGSLVVSPFTEEVKWILSLKPQKIAKTQLDELRKLNSSRTSRAIHPLHGRKVFYAIP